MTKFFVKPRLLLAGLAICLAVLISPSALAVKPDDRVTIVDVAQAINAETGEFSTLIASVVGTGLDEVLDGNGQYTVFAPTDAAFATIGLDAAAVTAIIDSGPEGEELIRDIVLYHVARGYRDSGDVLDSEQIRMITNGFTYPDAGGPSLFDNLNREVPIIGTDVGTDNGVIHVLGGVLLPFL
jgi:transforming growth factor-beta-induced protein